jgi:hypothetical protein
MPSTMKSMQQGGKPMTFDQWLNQVSKATSLQSDESQKGLNTTSENRIFELNDEDFEEDESSG